VVIENKAGAGGNVGAETVAKPNPTATPCCRRRRRRWSSPEPLPEAGFRPRGLRAISVMAIVPDSA